MTTHETTTAPNGAPAKKTKKKAKAEQLDDVAGGASLAPFPTAPTGIRLIPLEAIRESPTNPRKTFDAAGIAELAGSLKRHGQLEPVLVRELPDPEGTDKEQQYELVFGARRYRAAKLAGLEVLQATVRELTDEQVLEIQIVENAKRADIHPIEEAEGFKALHVTYGHTVDEIAAMVGKTKATVYARLKLCDLVPRARKMGLEGTLSPSVLVMVARMPAAVQDAFLKAEARRYGAEGIPAREAFRIIEGRYMLRLAEAPFDRGDATLVPDAGTCADCTKRTGNQRELFADVKSADVCTDPACFAQKNGAHATRKLEELAAAGATILEGKAAQKALGYSGDYQSLDDTCHDLAKPKKYSALVKGKEIPRAAVLQKHYDGSLRVVELVKKKDLAPILKEAGVKRASASGRAQGLSGDEEKKRRQAAERKRAKSLAVVGAVVAAAEKKEPSPGAFWPFVCELLILSIGHDEGLEILKRRGVDTKRASGVYSDVIRPKLKAVLEQLDPAGARGLAIEMMLGSGTWQFGPYGGESLGKGLQQAAAYFKVDVAKVGGAAVAALKEKKAAKKSAKRKAKP